MPVVIKRNIIQTFLLQKRKNKHFKEKKFYIYIFLTVYLVYFMWRCHCKINHKETRASLLFVKIVTFTKEQLYIVIIIINIYKWKNSCLLFVSILSSLLGLIIVIIIIHSWNLYFQQQKNIIIIVLWSFISEENEILWIFFRTCYKS